MKIFNILLIASIYENLVSATYSRKRKGLRKLGSGSSSGSSSRSGSSSGSSSGSEVEESCDLECFSDKYCKPLFAGKHILVGKVCVEYTSSDYIKVDYFTDPDWKLTEIHTEVANSYTGIPTTKSGNPKIGKFDFKKRGLYTNHFSKTFPCKAKCHEDYFVATHAVVKGNGKTETGWAGGCEFPGSSWAKYFKLCRSCDSTSTTSTSTASTTSTSTCEPTETITEPPVTVTPPPVTETETITEPPVTVTSPPVTETETITEPPVTVTSPPVTETETITEPPVTVTSPPVTETETITEPPVTVTSPPVTETETITEPPVTVTPPPVTETETITEPPVTVTPPPVTETETITEPPVTVTETSVPTCTPTPPVPGPVCELFGEAGLFNGWFKEDFTSQSDTQGRLAAGGDINLLTGYSVGDQLPPMDCSVIHGDMWNTTTVAGRTITWPSGRNYYGNIAVGDFSGSSVGFPVTEGLEFNCTVYESNQVVDFENTHTCLINKSDYLSTLSDYTATITYIDSGRIDVTMPIVPDTPDRPVISVNIDPLKFNTAYELNFVENGLRSSDLPNGPIIIVNVPGTEITFGGLTLASWTARRQYTIWNFYEATVVNMQAIEVEGTVMAPNADFVNPQGVIQGQIFGNSFDGPMQINSYDFKGCFDFTGVC